MRVELFIVGKDMLRFSLDDSKIEVVYVVLHDIAYLKDGLHKVYFWKILFVKESS